MRAYSMLPADIAQTLAPLGHEATPDARGIKAVDSSGRSRGGVVYVGWTKNLVHAHMLVTTPIAWRALLPHVLWFPFVTCGRSIILATIRSTNEPSLRLASRLGFRVLTRVYDAIEDGVDLLFLELRREWCKWMDEGRIMPPRPGQVSKGPLRILGVA